jgi:hypothetical protein
MPWWVLEGAAELAAERYARNADKVHQRVRRWMIEDALAPWDQISDFRNTPAKWGGHVYTQGHAMLGYVSEKHGRAKRNAWLTAMARGDSIDAASRAAFGAGFAEIDAGWRVWLAETTPAHVAENADMSDLPENPPKR